MLMYRIAIIIDTRGTDTNKNSNSSAQIIHKVPKDTISDRLNVTQNTQRVPIRTLSTIQKELEKE